MNVKTGDPQRIRAEIELLESFFKRFGKEFKDSLKEIKLSVEEYGWADWYAYDLRVARTNELIEIPQEGNCICRVKLDGSATIRLNNPQAQAISLETTPKVYGIPFKRLYLTNAAQSGKKLLLLVGKGDIGIEKPIATTKPTIYNIHMTDANTEYSQTLPAGIEKFTIHCREGTEFRLAFEPGKVATPTEPYYTIPANTCYWEDHIKPPSLTVYVACSQAGKTVEIITWS